MAQSGDPEVMLLHNATSAENLENSSISDDVAPLARAEFAAHFVKYGPTAAVSPELTWPAVSAPVMRRPRSPFFAAWNLGRIFLVRRQVSLVLGSRSRPDEVLVGQLVATKLGLTAFVLDS